MWAIGTGIGSAEAVAAAVEACRIVLRHDVQSLGAEGRPVIVSIGILGAEGGFVLSCLRLRSALLNPRVISRAILAVI